MIRRQEHSEGFVYFAAQLGVADGPIKIGWSVNPWYEVLAGGRRWTWFGLDVVATVKIPIGHPLAGTGFDALEQTLHRTFALSRMRGEWFRRTTEISDTIDFIKCFRPTAIDVLEQAQHLARVA